MTGRLGTAAPAAAKWTTLATMPADMTINFRAVNHDKVNAVTVRVALSPAATAPNPPAQEDYVEPIDLVIRAGGVLEDGGIAVSANEVLTVWNSAQTVTWRAYGR